ncbi:MAG TPA: VOC family protein [Candidatus Saccharimonadales bacterium]|nr:VOC family protein [Candidatus Saccharimonadales bacterium]
MDPLQAIIGDYQTFLKNITAEIAAAGFDFDDFSQMDHMCYRVTTHADYKPKKQALMAVGALLGEAQVNGRSISTFRLQKPVRYDRWRIDTVELPAPKEGVYTKEGLDHVELVLYDDMQSFMAKHPDKQFKTDAIDRGVNPEISFKLPNYTVKFHLLSLPTVVYLERKLGITDIR